MNVRCRRGVGKQFAEVDLKIDDAATAVLASDLEHQSGGHGQVQSRFLERSTVAVLKAKPRYDRAEPI